MTRSFPDIVERLRFGLADEGAMEDGAAEIERLRTALSTAEKVIYDLTDGITGTTQKDEIERLRCSADIVEAGAQALANDEWHPPQRLENLSPSDAKKYRRRARLVLEAAGAAQPSWQPIETAPKDGSLIMIGGTGYAGWFWADAKWRDGWMMWSGENDEWTEECHEASHWMPLPAPPVSSTGRGGA